MSSFSSNFVPNQMPASNTGFETPMSSARLISGSKEIISSESVSADNSPSLVHVDAAIAAN